MLKTVIVVAGMFAACMISLGSAEPALAQVPAAEITTKYGLSLAPVPLDLHRKNRRQVALGSYLVNAVAGCNDCHTNPPYAPGGNPFLGQPEKINANGYFGGGKCFGPIISADITPDSNGLPAGLTRAQFRDVIRTGIDPSDGGILQVMPWPIFQNMTNGDLNAIYAYLTAIPSLPPPTNTCP